MSNKDIVLVIDDDRVDREILKSILSTDYYVVEAQDGQEGFEFLARHEQEIKCVVVDIYMPGLDGYGFLNKVNESGLKIPVIVTTSDSGEETQVKVLAEGAWDFIMKPFNANIVKLRVQNAIMRTEFFAFKKLKYIAENLDSLKIGLDETFKFNCTIIVLKYCYIIINFINIKFIKSQYF